MGAHLMGGECHVSEGEEDQRCVGEVAEGSKVDIPEGRAPGCPGARACQARKGFGP